MANISIKGIVLGLLATLFLDTVSGVVGVGLYTTDFSVAAVKAVATDTRFLIISSILGTLSTVMGGFIAAKIGIKAPYVNSGLLGVLGLFLGLLLVSDNPIWLDIVGYAVIIPSALLGGFIAARNNK